MLIIVFVPKNEAIESSKSNVLVLHEADASRVTPVVGRVHTRLFSSRYAMLVPRIILVLYFANVTLQNEP